MGKVKFVPKPETLELLRESGNPINGLGENAVRRPSPFFWHPPDKHPFGDLQAESRKYSRKCPGAAEMFKEAYQHPELVPISATKQLAEPVEFDKKMRQFALANQADMVGVAAMNPLWVYEGYEINDPWVIILGFAHRYDDIVQLPSNENNGIGVTDVGRQYARGTQASFALANWIRIQGYNARAFPGPAADALLLIPPAIEAGFGELGKHGSLISSKYGSGFRLAGVTTDLPLLADNREEFGADDFCLNCQVCANACPPDAISNEKQLVRGENRWYVDFDKCIPYFVEASSCGICIAVCPWTRPEVRPNLITKMANRRLNKKG